MAFAFRQEVNILTTVASGELHWVWSILLEWASQRWKISLLKLPISVVIDGVDGSLVDSASLPRGLPGYPVCMLSLNLSKLGMDALLVWWYNVDNSIFLWHIYVPDLLTRLLFFFHKRNPDWVMGDGWWMIARLLRIFSFMSVGVFPWEGGKYDFLTKVYHSCI